MTKAQFSNLLLMRDYKKVEQALQNGFDPNTKLEQKKPALEWCSYSDDYRMMEILWKAGAKPTTPATQEIVEKFEKGKTYKDLVEPKKEEEPLDDLTKSFSVKRLNFLAGEMIADGKDYSITIPVSPFLLDGKAVNTSIRLGGIELGKDLKKMKGKTITFPVNPAPGYIDGSLYLRSAHNPVDVTAIKIVDVTSKQAQLELTAEFLFEFERIGYKNEKMVVEITVNLK